MTLQEEVEEVFVAADILPPSPPPLLLIEPLPPPVYTKTSFTLWPLPLLSKQFLQTNSVKSTCNKSNSVFNFGFKLMLHNVQFSYNLQRLSVSIGWVLSLIEGAEPLVQSRSSCVWVTSCTGVLATLRSCTVVPATLCLHTAEQLNGSSWGCFGDQMLMLGANINTGCYHYYHYVIIIGINNQLTNKYNQTNTIVI